MRPSTTHSKEPINPLDTAKAIKVKPELYKLVCEGFTVRDFAAYHGFSGSEKKVEFTYLHIIPIMIILYYINNISL